MGLCVADWRDAKQQTGWDGSVGELSTLAVELDFEAEVSAAELVRWFVGLRDNRMGFVLRFRMWLFGFDAEQESTGRNWQMTVGIDLEVLKANSSVAIDLIANYGRIQVIAVKK
ncbi:hypothetical protein F0562_018281 [Nyssa sinensis]|uniref:Uncharacterized protein n=1 Tax=Nyssa sinensis TaxID=561372 RepID=A0A5J4ZAZ7_9ASTE|nr:hypothetical protein F0562_018281 [Nyssa sinensis]